MQQQLINRSKSSALCLALLSLSLPGIGQIFGGRLRHACILFVLMMSLIVIMGNSILMNNAYCAIVGRLFTILFLLYIAIDAYKINSNKQGVVLKWYNEWCYYILFIVCIGLIQGVIVSNAVNYKYFRIPTKSNYPTIQTGDFVMAKMLRSGDSFYYTNPKYNVGSFVIFTLPNRFGKTSFIKRIVAIGGDKYFIKSGVAYLNDKPVNESYILSNENTMPDSKNYGPVIVPSDSVLVFGDNRDDSFDSRYYGFISTKNIEGVVLYILWSRDLHRIGLRLD